MRTHVPAAVLAITFASSLFAAPAQATGAPRTFVSAAGSDSNNCTNVATPCRHLAAAFAATAADGEIYVLDPANYGSLTITHAVSIEGHGWASIAPVSGAAAISINASPTDKINIIGVVLDGTNLTNTTGIIFFSGVTLNVRDSVIRNFASDAINFAPNSTPFSQLVVSHTVISDCGSRGINITSGSGTMNGVLDHVQIENNGDTGLLIASSQTNNVTITDSVIANNNANGIHAAGPVNVMVRNSTIANNGVNGLRAEAGSAVRVTRSTITGNATGWLNSGGAVLSYGDNNIDGNGNANTAPPTPLPYH